jgi:dipeptidyl aminopeptidase/acylaminoacyl peptidase
MYKLSLTLLLTCLIAQSQGTRADYDRAFGLAEKARTAPYAGPATAINDTPRYWYRRGNDFLIIDADKGTKAPAFDNTKLAAALTTAIGKEVKPDRLPFTTLTFNKDNKSIEVVIDEARYRIDLDTYAIERRPALPRDSRYPVSLPAPTVPALTTPLKSPNGETEAFIRNHNLWVRPVNSSKATPLTFDGSEDNTYRLSAKSWSPDSLKLALYRVRLGLHRKIAYIESSPADQVQPKHSMVEYAKPGDTIDIPRPVLINLKTNKQIEVDPTLFANPYSMSPIKWRKDSSAFTFEYNQRGHQAYRIIEVDASSGTPRALVSEESPTFFCYYSKRYAHYTSNDNDIIWMSEREGWNHLYLYARRNGGVTNAITQGNWVVRSVAKVDDAQSKIYFSASGMYPGKDPYYLHWFRVNFDGTGLTPLTNNPDVTHSLAFSDDFSTFVDTYSSYNQPPTVELRRTFDSTLIATLEKPTLPPNSVLPTPFTAKGRDGSTDIWGLIFRPSNFDPKKKYPVLEYIYAGPHDSFVPKTFNAAHPMQAVAELGFIVVQMDGMGTSNRSKAFHDYAWKNIADAGFPDRILWHKAAAAKYPWYDISRVGIYGHSAGGQNSLGALLFHGDFYKAAASSAGCHDNRMDKISWNEQWMGWPVGPEYTASSNVEHAAKLKGKLLLAVGEMDTNVDPASTMQVVNALIKANKTFDFLFLPGKNHGGWGDYYDRKRADFFVRELLGVQPPEWNTL